MNRHYSTDAYTTKFETAVETLANQIIWANRPIHIRTMTLAEAQQLPIRKIPDVSGDTLRLVDIENFDLTACGGTHVAQTGGVGMIKIIKTERQKKKVRVMFACGGRALQDYDQKNKVLLGLSTHLTTGYEQLPEAIQKLQSGLKAIKKQ